MTTDIQTKTNRTKKNAAHESSTKKNAAPRASTKSGAAVCAGKLVVKLGVDVHERQYVVVRQEENAGPQPPQRFTPDQFVAWAAKLVKAGHEVHSCYEAGCFGYGLHRRLVAAGVNNLVVRARKLDEHGSRVKNDARDAGGLCRDLDRYLAGNTKALAPVRVPTGEEEQRRALGRAREKLRQERQRLDAWGSSQARFFGYRLKSGWWRPKRFAALAGELPKELHELLGKMQPVAEAAAVQLKAATAAVERHGARELPKGLGALTAALLDMEFCDYGRFNYRRQVSSYTGLCPGEDSSGGKRRTGSITKVGNGRLRRLLLELAWRLWQFQPNYRAVVRWRERLCAGPGLTGARKKKVAVALAREFAVDWWRLQTGRATAEDLGLAMALPTAGSLNGWRADQEKNGPQKKEAA